MIKARSKSKLKNSTGFAKKESDNKVKGLSKETTHRKQDKQNTNSTIPKFSMTTVQSKKKLKQCSNDNERSISPLCFNKKKNDPKNEDQKFIEKLFSHHQPSKYKQDNKNYLVQRLIQGLVPQQNIQPNSKSHQGSHGQSTDFIKELHLKNQEVARLKQQIQELKLYISTFSFKVFDLTVLCRKYGQQIPVEGENIEFNRQTDQVIAYLDSLIRHWNLQDKIRVHCQNISKKLNSSTKPKPDDQRKRCHTESLKIPIEDYLESLQNTGSQNLKDMLFEYKIQQEPSEQIMKILSRRSSAVKKEQQEIYVVIKAYKAKNEHELDLRPGQRVSVLQKSGNQRWLGLKDGKIGYFVKQSLF